MDQYSVIIVGAGLAGLMAANELEKKGIDYLVVDKGRSVGGRMATRRFAEGRCDHGAQFFTARSETMKTLVHSWEEEGLVNVWTNGFPQMESIEKLESLTTLHDGYPRYAGKDGMNAITKQLAKGNNLKVNHKVEKIEEQNGSWVVTVTNIEENRLVAFQAEKVIVTSPIPQTLEMLDAGNTQINRVVRSELEKTSYFPCVAALITLDKESKIPSPGGIQIAEGMVGFLGDNKQKGISHGVAITIHGGDRWSRENYDMNDEKALNLLMNAAKPLLGEGKIVEKQLKRWRYSKPENLYPDEFAYSNTTLPIAFAGDIFKRGAVEGAILSGIAAAKWILEK